jgi:hypothetical protein
MNYVESPTEYGPTIRGVSVFLAGGITGCPDWQAEAVRLFQAPATRDLTEMLANLTILNPRRANFPIGDPTAAEAQIAWEYRHLHRADAVLFWFPEETLCPIVLYELGYWNAWRSAGTEQPKPIFVGTHPEYARRADVLHQTHLARPGLRVVHDLRVLVEGVRSWAYLRMNP